MLSIYCSSFHKTSITTSSTSKRLLTVFYTIGWSRGWRIATSKRTSNARKTQAMEFSWTKATEIFFSGEHRAFSKDVSRLQWLSVSFKWTSTQETFQGLYPCVSLGGNLCFDKGQQISKIDNKTVYFLRFSSFRVIRSIHNLFTYW